MSNATLAAPSEAILNARDELARPESGASAVSWGAIVAGAVVASALSLALLMLGAGIGIVWVSPWSTTNVSVTAFGILAVAWFSSHPASVDIWGVACAHALGQRPHG